MLGEQVENSELIERTRNLWIALSAEDDGLTDVTEDTVRGASYAELVARGLVQLTGDGLTYVEGAFEELASLLSDSQDEDDE